MSLFSSSSHRGRLVNGDGTRNVYCWNCKEFICQTTLPMSKAICVICDAAMTGKALTVEAVQAYELEKLGKGGNSASLLVLPEVPPGEAKTFTLKSMANEFIRVVKGNFHKPAEKESLPSVKASRDKRRGRILNNIDLGSMRTLDEQLRKDKE